ncbi:MAG: FAD-dependent oxidoreductase [Bacilli bacterium]|nr:FAD-dependent oxidoreductase [Bacilli bacterium]
MKNVDLVIIGGGSAGLAASVGAFDSGIKDILIIERNPFLGGILNQCIHNGFGLSEFKEELTGPEFASRFEKQVEDRKIPYVLNTTVTSITKDKVVTYTNEKEGVVEVQAKAIIMAAGCYERNAGAIGIPGDRPAGVITAGQAQLFLNEYGYMVGKKVFILGSGDIGLIMARRLTLEGAKVLGVAELCAWSNGLNRNMVQCLYDYDIPLYLSHTVTRVIGKGRVEAIEISQVDERMNPIHGTEKRFDVDTLVLSIGLVPNNNLLTDLGVEVGRSRGAAVNQNYETSIEGIFSCGNVLHVHDLVDYVVDEAREAGRSAARYLLEGKKETSKNIPVNPGEGIGYVVPSKLDVLSLKEKTAFKFRVRKPSKNVFIDYIVDGVTVKSTFKPVIIPSEMEVFNLPKNLLENAQQSIVISMRAKE